MLGGGGGSSLRRLLQQLALKFPFASTVAVTPGRGKIKKKKKRSSNWFNDRDKTVTFFFVCACSRRTVVAPVVFGPRSQLLSGRMFELCVGDDGQTLAITDQQGELRQPLLRLGCVSTAFRPRGQLRSCLSLSADLEGSAPANGCRQCWTQPCGHICCVLSAMIRAAVP